MRNDRPCYIGRWPISIGPKVGELYDALHEDTEAKRLEAGEVLRSLVKETILTPENGDLQIDVRGDLAGILGVSLKTKTPAARAEGSQFEMVAGTGSNQNLRDPQVEVVAGIRLGRDRHSLSVPI